MNNLYTIGYALLILGFLYSMYAQTKVNTVYSKYFQVKNQKGITGMQVARAMLDHYGLYEVNIRMIHGKLMDNYDSKRKIISLSEGVYNGTSLSAIGVAAHETGHAIQDGEDYFLLRARGTIAPFAMVSSRLVWILFFTGFVLSQIRFIEYAALLFFVVFLFQIVTLPVEYDASRRALLSLEELGYITREEYSPIKKVLKAAITTYIASTLIALGQLLRLLSFSRRNQ